MSKSQKVVENQHRDEISTFEPRKIKKERNDSFENGTIGQQEVSASVTHPEADQLRVGAGSRISNGFHNGDLLQDIIAAKFSPNNHGPAAKNDKIRLMIEDGLSDESKSRVQEIFLKVEQFRIEEKLLLYLKLPALLTNPGGTVDPLRQPLNPLGNRYEIHQTIMWIRTHLEEDPDVSLPKQEVYDEYNFFCSRNSMKPLSTADFGKVMKQVYPRVRPRRLGTRGNSRYCYAGMRKRVKLSTPTLPVISGTPEGDDCQEPVTEMLGAASTLIREWAETALGLKFPTLSALARHLVENLCVDSQSLSAVCILSSTDEAKPLTPKIPETPPSLSTTPVAGKPGKLREATLQLQKKLQQREHIRDQKHRNNDVEMQQNNQGKEKTEIILTGNQGRASSLGKAKKCKPSQSPQTIVQITATKSQTPTTTTPNRSRKFPRSVSLISPQLNCDTPVSNNGSCIPNDFETKDEKLPVKTSRKRTSLEQTQNSAETTPEKQAKLATTVKRENKTKKEEMGLPLPKLATIQRQKISVIPPSSLKSKLEFGKSHKVPGHSNKMNGKNTCEPPENPIDDSGILTKDQMKILRENSHFLDRNDKLCPIDADALDDYLNGGNNSQEPEEELLQYFQQSSSSSSDVEVNTAILTEENQSSRSDKVSQLRLILQQNLKAVTIRPTTETSSSTNIVQSNLPIEKSEIVQKNDIILPTLLNHTNPTNSRRRVSFETSVIDHSQESNCAPVNTVPQSPNTRRRIFNFTPISPGPLSPINCRAASKPNSENASPFVSPRNTPVPRSRSNMAGICRATRNQKQFSRSNSCSAPYIGRVDNFVVPTSSTDSLRQVSIAPSPHGVTKSAAEIQVGGPSIAGTIQVVTGPERKTLSCASFLSSDLNSQKQLVMDYPSQENLQEIKNVYRRSQPADQEITELFNGVKPYTTEQYYRSQSVPLHRMVNPTLMSPISTQPYPTSFQSPSFNLSSSSSIAPTPVPSEFNDFGSTYLLDEVDANFIGTDEQFLMEDKEISSENITKILDMLDEEDGKGLNILPQRDDDNLIDGTGLMLDPLPNSNLNLPDTMLDPSDVLNSSVGDSIQEIIQSRSYPNTPLPPAGSNYPPPFTEDSNGSRSYPTTPLHAIQPQDVYRESNEPMLSSPTLNSLNLRSETGNPGSAESVCRNVSDLLEGNFLGDPENDADDLDPLSNFDGLQDVDSLAPLFTEVSDSNR